MTYKTSLLHLQPRQMTVTVTSNSKPTIVNRQQSKRRKSNEKTTVSISSSRHSSRRLRCTSFTTGTNFHRDLSPPHSSSPSPNNRSRSTSPAASIANFVRPIFPPCIQVKESLSPRFSRASSTIVTPDRYSTPPITNTSARTTLLIDHPPLPGLDNHNSLRDISNVPENCFEPETYRNLHPLNSNSPKKLSLSDPTLNQTRTLEQNHIVNDPYFSTSSFHRTTPKDHHLSSDDEEEEIEKVSSYEETSIKEKITTNEDTRRTHRKSSSPRHRLMTCTSGINDSLIQLTPTSNTEQTDNQDDTSYHVMQNRPP